MPKFIVKQGAQPGQEVSFVGNRIVFGRADDCEVVVADVNVSRHHAQAVILDGIVAVVDLNSSNGTFVNELPISRVFLMDGDEVRLGETILVFCDDTGLGRDFGAVAASSPRLRSVSNSGTMPAVSTGSLEELNRTQLFAPIPEDVHASALKEIYLKLKAVYRVFHEVAQAGSLKEMFEAVGRAVTISTGIERITFYLDSTKTGEPWQKLLAQTATRIDDKAAARATSGALMQRAREEMKAVAAAVDAEGNATFTGVEANAMAVPLLRGKQLMALIYADNPGTEAAISKNDMDFVATVALQLSIRLNQFEQVQQLKQENVQLRQKVDADFAVIVRNEKMKQIMVLTERVAESDSSALVTGESGTGKELIARSIHHFSPRSSKQLVAVNCAALPDTLLESELFGHEKGAFTGAVERRIGKFELADGGTLFLDEIGDISAAAQAKLLRALQEGEIQRIGGNKLIKVNVRLIAATNKNLAEEVQKGNFRQDLFFRIKVIEIALPPLRDRRDDVPALAEFFLKQFRQKQVTKVQGFSKEAMEILQGYSFPGNIRELKNIVERGLVFAMGDEILPDHLPVEVLSEVQSGQPLPMAVPAETADGEPLPLAELEKRHIVRVLAYAKGNKLRAASLLGISRTTLYEKLKAYGLSEEKV